MNLDWFEDIKSTSLLDFRRKIDLMLISNPSFEIEYKVKKYYEKLLNQYNNKSKLFYKYEEIINLFKNNKLEDLYSYNIFDYLLDRNLIIKLQDYCHYRDGLNLVYEELKKRTSIKISEIVVDGLFQDTIYNVWINIREMIRYNSLLDKKLLSNERVNFYQMILNIDNISCNEKIKLYHSLKDKNIPLMFYEDLRSLKNNAYHEIKEGLFKTYQYKNLLNNALSLDYGIPIYELDNEKFNMLISCRDSYKQFDCIRRHCYSLISDLNMNVYKCNRFIYGYEDIDINNILHMFESDSYSSNGNGYSRNSFTTTRVNRIMSLKEINSFESYNEIQIINKEFEETKFEVMKPNYLVVFDEIDIKHINEAKMINIPIVRINTKSYKRNDNIVNLKYEKIRDDYTEGAYQEENRLVRRLNH